MIDYDSFLKKTLLDTFSEEIERPTNMREEYIYNLKMSNIFSPKIDKEVGCRSKVKYLSKETAEEALEEIKFRKPDRERLKYYKCNYCDGYHLGNPDNYLLKLRRREKRILELRKERKRNKEIKEELRLERERNKEVREQLRLERIRLRELKKCKMEERNRSIIRLYKTNLPVRQLRELFGLSTTTIYRILRNK